MLPKTVTLGMGAFVLATLAIWWALLRLPLWWWSGLVLAAGVGLQFGYTAASRGFSLCYGWVRWTLAVLTVGVALLYAASTGLHLVRESQTLAEFPPAAPGAQNVVLLVLDTVRASHLSLYGYRRPTSPNLDRWAKKGVLFKRALAPAPWTLPTHATIFTGRWPFETDTQWKKSLDTSESTLAEFLASHGYQTAGFVGNTPNCNYESGLGRGFHRYEAYPLSLRSVLARTVPGKWLLEHTWGLADPYQRKWIKFHSRPASELNAKLLDWLENCQTDRPFFAFVNYFDAHDPYIPAPEQRRRFGVTPRSPADFQFLFGYLEADKSQLTPREYGMALDSYDDCIAFLDAQIGKLLDELERRKILENTVVIITSDHGEAFGEHGSFCHTHSVFLEEVGVPLLILAPIASAAGRSIFREVSLRDLPSTVADLVGLIDQSPFRGRSLAELWRTGQHEAPPVPTSPALSEQVYSEAFRPGPQHAQARAHAQMSIVGLGGYQYIRSAEGQELLFNLIQDPQTQINLSDRPETNELLGQFRRLLLDSLDENPGAPAAEAAYLKTFRRSLSDQLK
jgi:arylsulfatase A-like enzyme